jgi:hypothetical protein
MNHDIETKLAAMLPKGKGIDRDALFFELGKQQRKPYGLASAFLAGAIAASFPWLLLTQVQSQKIETSPSPSEPSLVLLEPAKSEPYSLLAYRKVFESTNDLPTLRYVEAGGQVETLSDLQKEFSLYHQ